MKDEFRRRKGRRMVRKLRKGGEVKDKFLVEDRQLIAHLAARNTSTPAASWNSCEHGSSAETGRWTYNVEWQGEAQAWRRSLMSCRL